MAIYRARPACRPNGAGGGKIASFACKDISIQCGWTATAPSENALMKKITKHAGKAHNMKSIDPATAAKMKTAIKL